MAIRISNSDDVIDSRQVIERIEELEERQAEREIRTGELAELAIIRELASEGEGFEDWLYGATLIRHTYFVAYAKQYAEDLGSYTGKETWPFNCIDWEYAAQELAVNYSTIEFDGVEYYIR